LISIKAGGVVAGNPVMLIDDEDHARTGIPD
jgi:hypothetical protein